MDRARQPGEAIDAIIHWNRVRHGRFDELKSKSGQDWRGWLWKVSMNNGNGGQGWEFAEPGGAPEEAAVSFTPPNPQGQSPVAGVVERNRAELAKIPGVHGVSEGRTPIGDPAVRIDVDDDSVRGRIPTEIEGYPVEVVVVPGGFEILPAR